MELPGWFPKSSQLAFGRPVVVAFCVVVGFAVVVVAVVVGLAGAATWLVAAPDAPPRIPGAANAVAASRESAHAEAIVVMDLRTFILSPLHFIVCMGSVWAPTRCRTGFSASLASAMVHVPSSGLEQSQDVGSRLAFGPDSGESTGGG
jgi:hypothetical protein